MLQGYKRAFLQNHLHNLEHVMRWDKLTTTSDVIYCIVFVYCVLLALWSWPSGQCSHCTALASRINLGFLTETAVHVCLDMIILIHTCAFDGDQRTRSNQSGFRRGRGCTDRKHKLRPHWSSVGASSKLMLCASLILLLRLIPWTGTAYGGYWRRMECHPNS